jgi:hypothetical protein
MNRILKIIIPFALLGAITYQFWPEISAQFLPTYQEIVAPVFAPPPCTHPIPYVLGTFDPKFNISKTYFLSALADAEAIWEKPKGDYKGRNLFVYSPGDTSYGVLKINLVYDYRQEATSKLSSLGIVVENNQASYDALKAKFTVLKADYESELKSYNAQVLAFNQGDRRNQTEFDQLQAEQKDLSAKEDEVNALVVSINSLVDSLNLSVDKFNTTSSSRGESFEEGVYSTNGADVNEINIYEFSSRAKLVRVLAHELGHALGLGHVADPKAIMYEKNQSGNGTLTPDDLAALKAKCEIK